MKLRRRRETVPFGFVAYTGVTWTNDQVIIYNRLQDTINGFLDSGLDVPEHLVNGSHNLFCQFSHKA